MCKINEVKKNTQTNGIKKIRDGFGLTQLQLANYLGVSLTMVGMAELGKRILPVSALLKLNLLDVHLHAPLSKASQQHVIKQQQVHVPALHKQMLAQNKELAYQITLHEKKLAIAESKHQQALQALSFAQSRQTQKQKNALEEKDMAWLQVLQMQAQKNLQKHHPVKQLALQNKINALQAEQKGLHQLMQGLF